MNPLIPLRDAWYFFSRHLSTIALLCLPWVLLENLLAQFIGLWAGESTSVPYSLLAGLLSPYYDVRVATRGDDALDASGAEEMFVPREAVAA